MKDLRPLTLYVTLIWYYDVSASRNSTGAATGHGTKPKRKKVHSYLLSFDFLVAFGVVLVAPRSELCAIVYVRVASPLAQAASTQSL